VGTEMNRDMDREVDKELWAVIPLVDREFSSTYWTPFSDFPHLRPLFTTPSLTIDSIYLPHGFLGVEAIGAVVGAIVGAGGVVVQLGT